MSNDAAPRIDLTSSPTVPQHPEGQDALPGLLARTAGEEAARAHVEAARRSVACLVRCDPGEVVFTSGGAEANNAAVKGLAMAALLEGAPRRVVLSAVEHPPVLHAARGLARLGFEVLEIPVDTRGRVDAALFEASLASGAALAALQWANDEIGTLQPVERIARRAAAARVPLHVDATASAGWIAMDWQQVPAASLALTSDRMGGPPAAGALVIREGRRCLPLIEGGIEEDGRRAGRLHPALITGFGITAAAASLHLERRAARARDLRDALAEACGAHVDGLHIHTGSGLSLPGHLHVSVPGAGGEALLTELRRAGIAAESGSACVEGAGVPSAILRACGFSPAEAMSSLLFRVTASHDDAVPAAVAAALGAAAARLRALAP